MHSFQNRASTLCYWYHVQYKMLCPVNSKRERERKSMSSVNSGWSNYLLSLHSFQSEYWAWLSEYNPLILFCSLIKKLWNGQMRLDRCWKSGLIFLIAWRASDTLSSLYFILFWKETGTGQQQTFHLLLYFFKAPMAHKTRLLMALWKKICICTLFD